MNLVFGTYPPLLGGESPNEPAQLMREWSGGGLQDCRNKHGIAILLRNLFTAISDKNCF